MGEDLQSMVDRMILKGCVDGSDVEAVAALIEHRLGVFLRWQDFVQLADLFIQLSIDQQEEKQPQQQPKQAGPTPTSFRDIRDEEEDEHYSNKEASRFAPSPPSGCEAASVQSVGTTRATSESAGSAASTQRNPQKKTPLGEQKAQDMDGVGASQALGSGSPLLPPRLFPNTTSKANHENAFLETFAPNHAFQAVKDENPCEDDTPFIDEMKAETPILSPRAGFCQDATRIPVYNLDQPLFSPNNESRGEKEKTEPLAGLFSSFQAGNGVPFQAANGVRSEFAFTLGSVKTNSRRDPRRQGRRTQKKSPTTFGTNLNSSTAFFEKVPSPSATNSQATSEVDPFASRITPSAKGTIHTFQKPPFEIGFSDAASTLNGKLDPIVQVNGSTTTTSAGSPYWPEASFFPSKMQPLHCVEPDFTGTKDMIFSIEEEAWDSYMEENYGESIGHYTRAIKLAFDSLAWLKVGDLLALLYSNRAAALMMIGAYEASSADCADGLSHVSKPVENVANFSMNSGPPLSVKLQARLGRALLKQGEHEGARKAFEKAISDAYDAIDFCRRVLSHTGTETLLNQMIAEATLGRSDAERLRVAVDDVAASMQQIQKDSSCRHTCSDALTHVRTAMSIASGSVYLYEQNVIILSKTKRWREVAVFCERIAASHSRMGGMFVGDLEGKIPFLVSSAPEHLVPTYASEENAETGDRMLNSKAAAEAVLWIPSTIIPLYLRALRLEERYPAADACLTAIENFLTVGSARSSPAELKHEFSWVLGERSKLIRTKTEREKGDERFKCSDYKLAAAHYANALIIDAEGSVDCLDSTNAGGRLHAVLRCNRAACLMAMKDYKGALEECTGALDIHPIYMKALLRRARCYCHLSRYQEAICEYKHWVDLVEEARRAPACSTRFVSPCLFDGPKDVTDDALAEVTKELESIYATKSKAEAMAREQAMARREQAVSWEEAMARAGEAMQSLCQQHCWNNDFSAAGSTPTYREAEEDDREQSLGSNDFILCDFCNRGPRETDITEAEKDKEISEPEITEAGTVKAVNEAKISEAKPSKAVNEAAITNAEEHKAIEIIIAEEHKAVDEPEITEGEPQKAVDEPEITEGETEKAVNDGDINQAKPAILCSSTYAEVENVVDKEKITNAEARKAVNKAKITETEPLEEDGAEPAKAVGETGVTEAEPEKAVVFGEAESEKTFDKRKIAGGGQEKTVYEGTNTEPENTINEPSSGEARVRSRSWSDQDGTNSSIGSNHSHRSGKSESRAMNKKYAWKLVPPKLGNPNTKIVGGKEFHFCPNHGTQGQWVVHKLEECNARGKTMTPRPKIVPDVGESSEQFGSNDGKVGRRENCKSIKKQSGPIISDYTGLLPQSHSTPHMETLGAEKCSVRQRHNSNSRTLCNSEHHHSSKLLTNHNSEVATKTRFESDSEPIRTMQQHSNSVLRRMAEKTSDHGRKATMSYCDIAKASTPHERDTATPVYPQSRLRLHF